MAASFQGSVIVLVLLLIICFPIGLVYLIISWKEAGPSAMPAQQAMRTCTNCGVGIPMNYNVCPHCGKPVEMYQAPVPLGPHQ